jgi:uncharacterized protein (DUF1501 family)
MSKNKISRREFIGQASCAGLGSMAFLNTVLNLGMINTVSARPHILNNSGDYKAIICILLAGGADSFNMLIPSDATNYAEYSATRSSTLAIPQANLLPLNFTTGGRTFGVNPAMAAVHNLFNQNKLSFVTNIGTLIEPIANKTQFNSGTKKVPLGLYSHSDQIMQWQTSVPQDRNATGFAGRMADLLQDMNTIDKISMNISLAGTNRFQAGKETIEFTMGNNSTASNIGFEGYPQWVGNAGSLNDIKDGTILSMAEQQYSHLFQSTYGKKINQSYESLNIVKDAFARLIPINTTFSNNNFSKDLKKIAEMISVRSYLGANRQIFFVSYGGWDHHDNTVQSQATMLPVLSNGLAELNAALEEIGIQNDVTTFTISDFARTLTSNGNGSDHAWGGNCMIMGGDIDGGKIFGNYPSLGLSSANTLNLSNRGLLIPTKSVDEFYAEIALWYGASVNDMNYILPNLCNFHSSAGCIIPNNFRPIGMYKI